MKKNESKNISQGPTIKLYEAIFVTIVVLFLIYFVINIFS